jgi:RNA polymerase sigma-70 factor (ECF subfamily)
MKRQEVKYSSFLQLLLKNQEKIYGFIFANLPDFSVADDIMQETILTLWSKFDSFNRDSSFSTWAIGVAHYKILEYRAKSLRQKTIFSSKALDNILANKAVFEQVDVRMNALERCLEKLKDNDRTLIKSKYIDCKSIKQIANETNRSIDGLYKVMARIHSKLQNCINKAVAKLEAI